MTDHADSSAVRQHPFFSLILARVREFLREPAAIFWVFQILRDFYGTDDIAFTFVSDEFNGITKDAEGNVRPLIPRSFSSLSEAEEENGQSRIYLGPFYHLGQYQSGQVIRPHCF